MINNLNYQKYKKGNLPIKVCLTCKLPFNWRKNLRSNWLDVKFCSNKCRKLKNNDQK